MIMHAPHMRPAGSASRPLPRRVNLTQAAVSKLVCPADKPRVMIYDARAKGLAVQVTRAGARSYYFYGRIKGRPDPIKHRVGDADAVPLDDARTLVAQFVADAARGNDPTEAERAKASANRQAESLSELWKRYLDTHLKPKDKKHTIATDTSRYNLHLSKRWGSRKINTITPDDIAELHAEITAGELAKGNTGNAADKAVKLLRRMFTFGKINPNPAARAVKFHGDKERQRFLSRDEVKKLLAEVEKAKYKKTADAIKFGMFTGARAGNVCSARWSDIHLDNGIWIIPKDQSKNGKPMTINLPPLAVKLLRERKAEAKPGAVYVFPGHKPDSPITTITGAWRAARERAGLTDVHFHDLRHTLASWMAMSGASLLVIGKQLGHASKQSTARYAHLEVSAVRTATAAALASMMPKPKKKPAKK